MDLYAVGDYYVQRIVSSRAKQGVNSGSGDARGHFGSGDGESSRIKVLLLDRNTTPTISMCATQSQLLDKEIYLVDTVENADRDVMRHLKCLVYVKPTDETVECLARELQNPKYGEYHLFFNNLVSKAQMEKLAEADDMDVVVKVEEIFQDYQILNERLFSLDIASHKLFNDQSVIWDEYYLHECTNNLVSLLLSLKVRPEIIRCDADSKASLALTKSVESRIKKNEKALFDFPTDPSAPTTLIILDRNDDPLTPLLQPWTYQSMIHEYIGIKRNIVDLSGVPNVEKELEKVTLSSKQDIFFHDTMYLNFGELGDRVKDYVSNYKDKAQINNAVDSIEDIKQFIEKYPEIKKLSSNVTKHMTIVGELDRQLREKKIWELSEVEQNLVAHKNNSEDYETTLKLLRDPSIDNYYKLKLACIYVLRYDELHPNDGNKSIERISEIIQILKNFLPTEDINYLHKFRNIFKQKTSQSKQNLAESETAEKDDLLTELAKKFNTKMELHRNKTQRNDVADNVYMQHIPKLSQILSDLSKNKLSERKYKYLVKPSYSSPAGINGSQLPPPQDVIIFVIGGVTFEESRFVHQFNKAMENDRMRVILGGTSLLSTKDFLDSFR